MQPILAESAAGRLRFIGLLLAIATTLVMFVMVRPHHRHHHGHHVHSFVHVGRCADLVMPMNVHAP
jgi:hypothetical protein